MKKSNIPEFIDFTKNLITVNAALIGGVFFKTKKSILEVNEGSSTSGLWDALCNAPITAYSAILFTISILLLFGFIAGIIEHKDSSENPVLDQGGQKIDKACVLGTPIVLAFAFAFILFITGLSFLCVSLF